ncbi:MAG: alkaline phosphatase D family protein [Akkermansiaceae bacterium]|nr:alkaline phosphatase D family protein [Armatimonadota bacterium]
MDKKTLQAVLSNPVTRRQFFNAAGMTSGLLLAGEIAAQAQVGTSAKLPSFPFTLGVASGDPTPDGVVLWTRLAPNPAGGPWNSARSRSVQYQVATTPNFGTLVRQGTVLALPQEAHSVHVELRGLQPSATYYYRFLIDGYVSRVGRTKTAPAAGANVSAVRFAFCSCSDYQNGFFTGYRAMAEEDIDFWVHLGDYIYEYDANPAAVGGRQHTATDFLLANGTGREQLFSLNDYRNRHSQYKQDAALQQLHATHPMIAVWDDHETENNYADEIDEIGDFVSGAPKFQAPAEFLLERAAAYQAWYEHMPVRRGFIVFDGNTPRWQDANLYRRFAFGNLLTLHMLDTRQYRTEQPIDLTPNTINQALGVAFDFRSDIPDNATGSLLGSGQRTWLTDGLTASTTRWNALGQQVMMARTNFNNRNLSIPDLGGANPDIFNVDQWDGYDDERQNLLTTIRDLRTVRRNAGQTEPNVVVLTGDIHSAWAHDIRLATAPESNDPARIAQWQDPANTQATEFVCSSISADFPVGFIPLVSAGLNPAFNAPARQQTWTKYFNGTNRGYVVCTVTAPVGEIKSTFRADFMGLPVNATGQVVDPNAGATLLRSLQTVDGEPGAIPA